MLFLAFLCPFNESFQYLKTVSSLRMLSLKTQFLLVMIKLRQNFDFKHMSHLLEFHLRTAVLSLQTG